MTHYSKRHHWVTYFVLFEQWNDNRPTGNESLCVIIRRNKTGLECGFSAIQTFIGEGDIFPCFDRGDGGEETSTANYPRHDLQHSTVSIGCK
jgi:hypothetical protein